MTWIAPEVIRIDEPFIADERTMLEGWLDCHRTTLLYKCAGLTGEQLVRWAAPPSNLSLLGLVRHMADVERAWFRRRLRGEQIEPLYFRTGESQDACFDKVDPACAEADYERLIAEWEHARQAAAGFSLDETVTARFGEVSLRWIYIHMIEEYARHNGHADLLRERIDGATGT
ncbi:DinB family protein [Planosporangium thailandense]|uniref:DinB family protein n=1 Tax=Planosporangium thailandense TaxID=765197 RepID=A0ABX0Y2U6_9ACTN|nr:DinB family protein [Planosporangium thailandense]NJC72690.1 DinB family protein [Planosporangium thailandense]